MTTICPLGSEPMEDLKKRELERNVLEFGQTAKV